MVDQLDGSPMLQEVLGDAFEPLRAFHVKLAEEGEPRGLIGPRDVDIIWERHILNSAAIVSFVREATEGVRFKTVADVGSGGGFPGLVAAACLPDHEFTLIEPMERRVAWLKECRDAMGLKNVSVFRARSEEVIDAMRRDRDLYPYTVVTCRAVAPDDQTGRVDAAVAEVARTSRRTQGKVGTGGDRQGRQGDRQVARREPAGRRGRGGARSGTHPRRSGRQTIGVRVFHISTGRTKLSTMSTERWLC